MIPIKKGITGTDIPNIAVETSDSTIPRKPILLEGGPAPEPITVTALNVTENGTYNAGENAAYNPVIVNVPAPNLENITITENGIFEASEGYDGIGIATVNVPGKLPDLEIVCEYDFTSATPKKDKARFNIEGSSNYIGFDTTKGAVFDDASSRFFNTIYNMNEGNSYKIEIEFGNIELNETLTGKRNIFSYVPNVNTINENSYTLGFDASNNRFSYQTGAGDRFINKPVDYWKNDTMTIYYGLSVDNEGKLWLPSNNIDNSSYKSLIIMDKDLITHLTSPFQMDNPNIVLGGGDNMFYFEVKKFRIYRINNLTFKPNN